MRRGIVIALAVLGVLAVGLMVALSSVGTNLDQVRLERDDLQFESEDLQKEVETLSTERDELRRQVDEQLKTIEQLKAEAGRPNNHAPDSSPAPASAP